MKRLAAILLFLLTLTGCSLAPSERLYLEPHIDSTVKEESTNALSAENYMGLKNAMLRLIRTGKTEGIIRVTNYDGDVEKDLPEAAYEVVKLDPLGAYAVDYMTHNCTQIVSYYEIRINITFRRTAEEIAGIITTSTQERLETQLTDALENYQDRTTVRISNYRNQAEEIPAIVADYCAANPERIMEQPSVSVSVYPESGNVRILEINFGYTHEPSVLTGMQRSVQSSLIGAAEYIRYRETELEKAELLFTYLTERFHYQEEESNTPLYDALCRGIADPTGLAQAWQIICDRAGVECYTVSGLRGGEPCSWNIICTDGTYRHVDLARCVLDTHELVLLTDEEMTDYYWNTELYPACIQPEETTEETDPQSEEATEEADPQADAHAADESTEETDPQSEEATEEAEPQADAHAADESTAEEVPSTETT